MRILPWPRRPDILVGEDGTIFGVRGRPLKGKLTYDGYLCYGISVEGKNKTIKGHRIVLETFVGPCPEGLETRHLDGNGLNNRLENLEWGSKKDNGEDRVKHGSSDRVRQARRGNTDGAKGKVTLAMVLEMRQRAVNGEIVRDFYKEYPVSYAYARKIVNGNAWVNTPGAVKRTTRGKIIGSVSACASNAEYRSGKEDAGSTPA